MFDILDRPKAMAVETIKGRFPDRDISLVDIGFGRGEFLKSLVQAGYTNLTGTESSTPMIKKLALEAPAVKVISAWGLPQKDYTITTCFEVLEHVEDPLQFLKDLPEGNLFLSTPNANRWWVSLTGLYEPWDEPPSHLHRFKKEALEELLEDAGYSRILVRELPVDFHRILQPFSTWLAFKSKIKTNTKNYETVRGNKIPIASIYRLARVASYPISWPVAKVMSHFGCRGESFYVEAWK